MKHNINFNTTTQIPKHLVWLTDLHLDATNQTYHQRLIDLINAHHPDLLLIGGDICNGEEALFHLEKFIDLFPCPLLFVLGNHDFYYGSITRIKNLAEQLSEKLPNLHYLTTSEAFPLTDNTAIIGHDGWSDGRAGDFLSSNVMLNDYVLIKELSGLQPTERLKILTRLGDEAAEAVRKKLEAAFEIYDHVILLTHSPPFAEACYYGDHPSDKNWSPHFVCHSMGVVLKESMASHPDKQLLVLAGHTHTGVDVHIAPNLRVLTGESELGRPTIQGMIYTG